MDIFFHNGNHYLVYVDRLSGWPIITSFPNRDLKTRDVTSALRDFFMSHGVPTRIRSDGGLQFASAEFSDFASKWGFRHIMSSPHYPQSNGHAESAVKAMKRLVKKASPAGHLDNDIMKQAVSRVSPSAHPMGMQDRNGQCLQIWENLSFL